MKRTGLFMVFMALIALLALVGCQASAVPKVEVVTSTSMLASIAARVGEDRLDVVNIIPPAQCPGHFDVKPGDIQKLADADLFLLHGWQGEKFSESLIDTADNPDLIVRPINVQGNWMAPPVHSQAVDEVTAVLSAMDEKNAAGYQKAAEEFKAAIRAKEAEVRASLAQFDLSAINILVAEQQAGFLQWLGFNVVATYGEPDTLTAQVVRDLVDKGRQAKVSLIVDNLQSGADAGRGIAEELGAKRITLSNFPGGFDDTGTWDRAVTRNIELLLEVLSK